jgi:hypothetical protein
MKNFAPAIEMNGRGLLVNGGVIFSLSAFHVPQDRLLAASGLSQFVFVTIALGPPFSNASQPKSHMSPAVEAH